MKVYDKMILSLENLSKFGRYYGYKHIDFVEIIEIPGNSSFILKTSTDDYYLSWITLNDMLELYKIPVYDYKNNAVIISGDRLIMHENGQAYAFNIQNQSKVILDGIPEVTYLSGEFFLYKANGYYITRFGQIKMILGKFDQIQVIRYCPSSNILEYIASNQDYTTHSRVHVRNKKVLSELFLK